MLRDVFVQAARHYTPEEFERSTILSPDSVPILFDATVNQPYIGLFIHYFVFDSHGKDTNVVARDNVALAQLTIRAVMHQHAILFGILHSAAHQF